MRRLAISIVLLAPLALARSTAAQVVPLVELEKLALGERPALSAGAASTRAAEAEIDRAERGYYPTLSLEAQTGLAPGRKLVRVNDIHGDQYQVQGARSLRDGDALDAFTPQVRNELNLELRGPLYDFGRTAAAVAAGRARRDASVASAEVTRAAILKAVRTAYLAWLGASELHAIAAQAATDAENRRARVAALIAEGVKPQADLTPARADELLVKLELERAVGDERGARLALEHAVGSPLPSSAQPDLSLLQRISASPVPQGSAALRALASQRDAAHKAAHFEDKADAPVLAAVVSAGIYAQATTPFPAYAVGLNLSVPLWDGGVAEASAAVARAKADQLSAQIREQQERERAEAAQAALDAENATARLSGAEALLEVCIQRLAEAEQSYELGAAGIDQVAQARALLRRAKTEVLLAKLARAEALTQ